MARSTLGRPPHLGGFLQLDPYGGVVACILLTTHAAIDTAGAKAVDEGGAQEDVVKPQAGIAFPPLSLVVPESVHRVIRVERADRIYPTLGKNVRICCAALRLQQGILSPGLGGIDI